MKRFTYFCACLIATCIAIPALAQTKLKKQMARKYEIQKRISQHQGDRAINFALFDEMIPKKADMTTPFTALMPSYNVSSPLKSPVLTARKVEILGSHISDDYGEMISFTPSASISYNVLKTLGYDVKFNGGCALIDNKYYGMSVWELAGMKMIDLYEFNTDTWEPATEEPAQIYDKSLLATETAKDPKSSKVFGQFFTSDLSALEWGFVDYATQSRTVIKKSQHRIVALGYGNDNFAYGVATDGNLYKIDPSTGNETLVGATGVKVMTSANKYYEQSGEIDPVSGEFYWAATDGNMVSKLYTVNLTTGAATEIGALPDAVVGMAIPGAEAADGAPNKVTDVSYSFANGSLSGKVKFTAPTTTYAGDALPTGTALSYTIYVNGKKVAEGTVKPGETIEPDVTVPEAGMCNFKIITSNAVGEGAKFIDNQWVGHDEMAAPGDITMTRSGSNNSHVKITWTASTETLHDGYIGNVTYSVYRVENGKLKLVSEKQSGLTFEEDLPADAVFGNYYYVVQTINGDVEGEYDQTEEFYYGKAYEPNYSETFDNEASTTPYIKVNRVKGSYNDWEWDKEEKYMKCSSSFKGKSDSWLISPPIHLKAGYTYFIKYDVITPAAYKEKLEVKWGKDANDNETLLTEQLMPVTEYPGKASIVTNYEKEITISSDGNYNFGFHAVSESGSYFVAIDNFKVELGPLPTAPASVTNLSGETEPSGLDEAFIKFTAPTKNRKGETITSLDKIVVMSGDRMVGTVSPVTPGQVCTVHDTNAEHGDNTYDIYAYNENGVGQKATITIKVGQDKPGAIPSLSAIDQLNSVKLTWKAPGAAEGGLINPAGLWYQIHYVKSSTEIEEIGQTAKGVTEYTIEDFKTYEGAQRIAYWAVTPRNASGGGPMKIKSMLVGKPYQMPHHRSFANGSDDGMFMAGVKSEAGDEWIMLKGESSDKDNGCLYYDPKETGSAMIMLGKVSLRGAVNPQLIFDYKCTPNAKRKMVLVAQPMNGTAQRIDIKDFNTITNAGEWQKAVVKLPKELTKTNYISFIILGEATEQQAEAPIYVDNFNFVDPLPNDAAVELVTPKTVNKGHKVDFKVKITNLGQNDLDAKTMVKISVNGTEVSQVALTKTLKTTDYELLPVSYQTSLNDAADQLDVKAEVVAAGDVEKKNNIDNAIIEYADNNMPKPENVTSTGDNTPVVGLSWSEPAIETPTVTEDFESYDPWSTTMGEWTLVDVDKGYNVSLDGENFKFPHNREQFAFIVAQPKDYPDNKYKKHVTTHSGDKCAMSFLQVANLSKAVPMAADNWMISPALPGKAQTIDFWVKNTGTYAETFEVRYSKGINPHDIRKFIKIGDTHTTNTGQWVNISVDLPEGARFFAIRQNSPSSSTTMFMIDDITFMKGNTPVAYNIYRDGILIGTSTDYKFEDQPNNDGTHTYSITAVYAGGMESEPVEVNVVTDIRGIESKEASSYNVYTLDGVQVLKNAKDLNSLRRGIYIINGKKVMINK